MTDLRTAAQQALEALEDMLGWQSLAPQTIQESAKGRAAALRAALAEPDGPCPTCVALARTVMMDQMGSA